MTILARSFQRFDGTAYVVLLTGKDAHIGMLRGKPIAQGVFKTLKGAENMVKRLADVSVMATIEVGVWDSDTTIVTKG